MDRSRNSSAKKSTKPTPKHSQIFSNPPNIHGQGRVVESQPVLQQSHVFKASKGFSGYNPDQSFSQSHRPSTNYDPSYSLNLKNKANLY